jgi:hypothetical protein
MSLLKNKMLYGLFKIASNEAVSLANSNKPISASGSNSTKISSSL